MSIGRRRRWSRARTIALGLITFLLLLFAACQVLYLLQRRCPKITGIVVDMASGRPVVGAEVMRNLRGYSRNPVAALGYVSGPFDLLPERFIRTGADGRFEFPAQYAPWISKGWAEILFGGPEPAAIRLVVYQKDFILVDSKEEGFEWTDEQKLALVRRGGEIHWKPASPMTCHVMRTGGLWRGYDYRVEMVRAESEEQWRWKCDALLGYGLLTEEPWVSWLFNDLTGYLERWPQGEKAGEYFKNLLRFALPMNKEDETRWYSRPRTDYSCAELRRAIAANALISILLPQLSLTAVYANDPLGRAEFQRDLPDGYERGTRYAKWLLEGKCHN